MQNSDDGFVKVTYSKHGKTKKTGNLSTFPATPIARVLSSQDHNNHHFEDTIEEESASFSTPFHSINSSLYNSGLSTPSPFTAANKTENLTTTASPTKIEDEDFKSISIIMKNIEIKQEKKFISLRYLMQNQQNYTKITGFSNNGNFCYLNASIQVLLSCQPFHRLLSSSPVEVRNATQFPLIESFKSIIREIPNNSINTPHFLIKYLQRNDGGGGGGGGGSFLGHSQEDAQEFLTFILDSLHEEFIKLGFTISSSNCEEGEGEGECSWEDGYASRPYLGLDSLSTSSMPSCDGDWMVSKGRNSSGSSIEQRTLTAIQSPISQLFFGEIKSIVKRKGKRDSWTVEPFHCLSLPIRDFNTGKMLPSLEASLVLFQGKESISLNFQKEIKITKLPPLLLIHLKRMVFENGTIRKIIDPISIPESLELIPDGSRQRHIYRLRAVIYHLGREAHGGHYTCHIRNGLSNSSTWWYVDDSSIREDPSIINGLSTCNDDDDDHRHHRHKQSNNTHSPYILFYQRQKSRTINKC